MGLGGQRSFFSNTDSIPVYLREVVLRRADVPDFDRYPFALPSVAHLDRIAFPRPVTFFVGENGSGKSTILEAIAVALGFNAEGGSRNVRFGTRTSHSDLHRYLQLVRNAARPRDGFFLRAESFYNVASEIERLDAVPGVGPPIGPAYGARALHEQSHGESFLALVEHRFRGGGLYCLDEPEAALSPMRQLTLLARIHELVTADSQFLIATHSPILLAYPEAIIYELSPAGWRVVRYEETEHFQVTRDFLNRYPAMLRTLFAPSRDGA
ncbi:MAG TPA: AAA family ATPase [Gemmatimonadaceae bacterium]